MNVLKSIAYRSEKLHRRVRRFVLTKLGGAEHVGRRATGTRTYSNGHAVFRKQFVNAQKGRAAYQMELQMRQVFGNRPWMTPILDVVDDWLEMPLFPEESRLDRIAPQLTQATRREVAAQALHAIFD